MKDNQNLTHQPLSQTPTQPIIPPRPKSYRPILIFMVVILFLLILGSAIGFYVFKQQSIKTAIKPNPSPTPKILEKEGLNPNTGNLYRDIKVRLKEVLK